MKGFPIGVRAPGGAELIKSHVLPFNRLRKDSTLTANDSPKIIHKAQTAFITARGLQGEKKKEKEQRVLTGNSQSEQHTVKIGRIKKSNTCI